MNVMKSDFELFGLEVDSYFGDLDLNIGDLKYGDLKATLPRSFCTKITTAISL